MGEPAPDKRLNWIGARVCSTLKIKDDVWKGILSGDSKCVLNKSCADFQAVKSLA